MASNDLTDPKDGKVDHHAKDHIAGRTMIGQLLNVSYAAVPDERLRALQRLTLHCWLEMPQVVLERRGCTQSNKAKRQKLHFEKTCEW